MKKAVAASLLSVAVAGCGQPTCSSSDTIDLLNQIVERHLVEVNTMFNLHKTRSPQEIADLCGYHMEGGIEAPQDPDPRRLRPKPMLVQPRRVPNNPCNPIPPEPERPPAVTITGSVESIVTVGSLASGSSCKGIVVFHGIPGQAQNDPYIMGRMILAMLAGRTGDLNVSQMSIEYSTEKTDDGNTVVTTK